MMYQIIEKEILNEVVQMMKISAPRVAKKCQPGQFIILRVVENGERIPLTIMDYDRENGTITIIYQMLGYTTKLLSTLNVGDAVVDFVGPLGMPTVLHDHKKVIGVAGGVGSAPLYPQLKELASRGVSVDVIIGGRTKEYVILGEEFSEFCDNVYYATNDGSLGTEGFVTTVLSELMKENTYDEVITIGPLPMMKAVVEMTKEANIPTMVSMNPIMIDGTGMCGGCRVTIDGETKFACVDGPDFDGYKVDFDEAIRRQNYYKEEEHNCKLGSERNA